MKKFLILLVLAFTSCTQKSDMWVELYKTENSQFINENISIKEDFAKLKSEIIDAQLKLDHDEKVDTQIFSDKLKNLRLESEIEHYKAIEEKKKADIQNAIYTKEYFVKVVDSIERRTMLFSYDIKNNFKIMNEFNMNLIYNDKIQRYDIIRIIDNRYIDVLKHCINVYNTIDSSNYQELSFKLIYIENSSSAYMINIYIDHLEKEYGTEYNSDIFYSKELADLIQQFRNML